MLNKFLFFLVLSLMIGFSISCDESYTPKPKGYFRIDMPVKSYVLLDTSFPYRFEIPEYSTITADPHAPNEKYWININYTPFNATLHISHKTIDGNLITYLEDAHKLVTKHIPKADAIYDSLIVERERNLFGLIYEIHGSGAASPYQFFLTDSITNFVRGALYFNVVPNNDSLEPVIEFISSDIEHLINTFEWKTNY